MTGSVAHPVSGAVASASAPPAFLPAKLRPPRVHVGLVARRRLQAKLAGAAPLAVVAAAAGWGKTTALVQWTAGEGRPAAWLRLDAGDNDPVVLLAGLLEVLPPSAGPLAHLAEALHVAAPPVWKTVVPGLAAAVAGAPPFLLVLDDAQQVTNVECWRIVQALLESLPPGARVVVSARTDPPLPLARLQAAGALLSVTGADLAFDLDETKELLELLGLRLPADEVEALCRSTEGWPTGLYLAAAALRSEGADPRRVLCGDLREISGYLLTEVLATQQPDVQDFLRRTAVLEHLNAALCLAVTESGDAPMLLRRVAADNLFVTAEDDAGHWYRYHQLFADFLRAELERHEPAAVAGLYRRAGDWCLEQGDVPQGVAYLLKAGDHGRAADVVSDLWTRFWESGQRETVQRMLRSFGDEQIRGHVPLALTAGWVYSATCDREKAERWARVACRIAVDDSPSPDGTVSLRSSQTLLRAALAPDGVARMRSDAELAARLEDRPGSNWHAEAQFHLGCALWLTGAGTSAERHLDIAAREGGGVNSSVELAALGLLGLIESDRGEWQRARRCEERATARLATLGNASDRRLLPLLLLEGRLLAHEHDPGLAANLAQVADALDRMVAIAWMTVLAGIVVGECLLAHGDLEGARRWEERARRASAEGGDSGVLEVRLQRLQLALKGRASQEVSPAELRVLAMLPTHLSLARIARDLCVSTNTVKTHCKSLYRKLDVGSRADAVEAARALGLLPPK